ncbi:hypothetical protein NEDG_00842 [Nematocida displodere]|uniref:Uncharacterized protein n=1 Tax=Nematocida displodere TaxID=1805483 RepID=A0A177EFE0_9MICR|nr:hypothetical protein NEDG_00842 [Nematocida displodere]
MRLVVEATLLESTEKENLEKGIEELRAIEQTDEDSFLARILLEYLEAKKKEVETSRLRYTEKKRSVEAVLSMYQVFLNDVLECQETSDLRIPPKLFSLLEKAPETKPLTREDKVLLYNEKQALKEKAVERQGLSDLLLYGAVDALNKIEMLGIERNVLFLSESPEASSPGMNRPAPFQIQRVDRTSHPVRITGKVLADDIRALLTQENGPTMTIEEYGERMKGLMDPAAQTPNTESDADTEPETNEGIYEDIDAEDEDVYVQRAKDAEKDEVTRGDGNRMGRR